jgi:hypothetical protein
VLAGLDRRAGHRAVGAEHAAVAGLGLSAAVGWLDVVLFPLLAVFLGLTGYGLYRRRRAP